MRFTINFHGRIVQAPRGEYVRYDEVRELLRKALELLGRENHILLYEEASKFLQDMNLNHRLDEV